MKICFFLIFITLFTCCNLSGYGQTDSMLVNIAAKLSELSSNAPTEKVHLHFDRPYYAPGDTIRFKAYLTVTDKHQLSAVSGIVYCDLIDPASKIAKSLKLRVVEGTATGDITLSDTLAEGAYRLRAYTNWMRNNSYDYFFDNIINITKVLSNQIIVDTKYQSLQIKGSSSQHAFITYTNKYGKPYSGKAVNYEIETDGKPTIKSAGLTNEKGELDVTLPPYNNALANNGLITTHITLYNRIAITKNIPIKQASVNDIQFFPEGGQQVNGVRSKIAFKAVGMNGAGIDVKGTILDNFNNEIAYFKSQHLGMGVFAMMPENGKTYKAKLVYADGSENEVPLPKSATQGFSLSVNTYADKLTVYVKANPELFAEKKGSKFYLVGQSGEKVYFTGLQTLSSAFFSIDISKDRFPSGIVQFTLFSQICEPLRERIAFVQHDDRLKVDIKTNKTTYSPREKVKLDISTVDHNNKPVLTNMSVSVINESLVPFNENAENNILSNLLLTSDLSGYVEQPTYYFNNQNDRTKDDLDVLLLTQGYRKFEWKEILANRFPILNFKPEHDLNLTGQLTNSGNKPLDKGRISIFSPVDNLLIDTVTDAQGKFGFYGLEFPDTTKLVIQARKSGGGKNVNISLDDFPLPKVFPNKGTGIATDQILSRVGKLSEDTLTLLQTRSFLLENDPFKFRSLNEVKIKSKKSAKPTIYNGYGAYFQYDANMAKLQDYYSIFDAMRRIPGISVENRMLLYDRIPLRIIIDGRVDSQDALQVLSPEEIESVSIVQGAGTPEGNPNNMAIITTKQAAGTDIIKLSAVNINAKRTKKVPEVTNSANLNGPGNADQVITGEKLRDCGVLLDCLKSRIFGASYTNGRFRLLRTMARKEFSTNHADNYMIVILDGVQLDTEVLGSIYSNDVSSVEILTSAGHLSLYGTNAPFGAIIVTTQRGAQTDEAFKYESVPGIIYYRFKGFYKARLFYSPKYDNPKTNTQVVDHRKTIYWNPNVNSDENGQASAFFFNSDLNGVYRITLEGIDDNGNIVHVVYKYKVE